MQRIRQGITFANVVAVLALVAALGGGAYAAVGAGSGQVRACAAKKGGALRLAKRCRHGERRVTWAVQGPAGVAGATGATGATGPAGAPGKDGAAGKDLIAGTPLPSGATETGVWSAGGGASAYLLGEISFPQPLAAALDSSHTIFVSSAMGSEAHCSGAGHADPGFLCVYENASGHAGFLSISNPEVNDNGASRFGAMVVYMSDTNNFTFADGTWAMTAP